MFKSFRPLHMTSVWQDTSLDAELMYHRLTHVTARRLMRSDEL